VTAIEGALTPERRARLADAIEASIDLDRLLALATPLSSAGFAGALDPGGGFGGGRLGPLRAKIGVAHDAAFQFYYPHNLDLLRAAGAELISWSPLDDAGLPDVDGLYFGGGYPELYARRLSDNAPILKAVAQHAGADKPIYAECGGLMYLAQTLEDMEGVAHRMVGLLPTAVHMLPRRLTLGYTEVCFSGSCPLGSAGQVARGHEFHYSTLAAVPASVTRVYHLRARRGQERAEGYLIGRALLSYVHLHFGSNPALADAFVSSCARARGARAC
jgi:cobyrinic acid a,c-diamide synthase